jgi:hypothetical protein
MTNEELEAKIVGLENMNKRLMEADIMNANSIYSLKVELRSACNSIACILNALCDLLKDEVMEIHITLNVTMHELDVILNCLDYYQFKEPGSYAITARYLYDHIKHNMPIPPKDK